MCKNLYAAMADNLGTKRITNGLVTDKVLYRTDIIVRALQKQVRFISGINNLRS